MATKVNVFHFYSHVSYFKQDSAYINLKWPHRAQLFNNCYSNSKLRDYNGYTSTGFQLQSTHKELIKNTSGRIAKDDKLDM